MRFASDPDRYRRDGRDFVGLLRLFRLDQVKGDYRSPCLWRRWSGTLWLTWDCTLKPPSGRDGYTRLPQIESRREPASFRQPRSHGRGEFGASPDSIPHGGEGGQSAVREKSSGPRSSDQGPYLDHGDGESSPWRDRNPSIYGELQRHTRIVHPIRRRRQSSSWDSRERNDQPSGV